MLHFSKSVLKLICIFDVLRVNLILIFIVLKAGQNYFLFSVYNMSSTLVFENTTSFFQIVAVGHTDLSFKWAALAENQLQSEAGSGSSCLFEYYGHP